MGENGRLSSILREVMIARGGDKPVQRVNNRTARATIPVGQMQNAEGGN